MAGPVAVGAFCVLQEAEHMLSSFFPKGKVRDSKKLTEPLREKIFKVICREHAAGRVAYAVSFSSERIIDRKGLSFAIRRALRLSLKSLPLPEADGCRVLLDGGLRAPRVFRNQQTIVKGDEKEAVIALASIAAKVLRDRRMRALGRRYPLYGFQSHKGYATKIHFQKIEEHGISPVHRKSFLKKFKLRDKSKNKPCRANLAF